LVSAFLNNPIRIIPDANVLFADPFLLSVAAKTILAAADFMEIKLVISEVTLDEVGNLVEEQLNSLIKDLNKTIQKARNINFETGVNEYGLVYESKKAFNEWKKRWEAFKTTSQSLPYPNIGTKELANRSIKEFRPFLEGDKGFRDCLLWISILMALSTDKCNYILVSHDHGFYDGESDRLHPDLEKELVSHSWSGRVLARRSFAAVVDEFIKPYLKADQAVEVAIKSGRIFDFTDKDDEDHVGILINEYLVKIEIPSEWITVSDYYSADFDVAEDVTMTDLISTLQLDNKVLATSEWEASVVIEVSCPGYQNESEMVIVRFKIESLIDPNTLEVESHEVTECELIGWHDPETKERINL
jgi:hypothetical protein